MPAIARTDVAHLARLARIDVTEPELDRLSGQLAAIVDAVASVSAAVARAETESGQPVPATSHPIPLRNVTRPDVVAPGLSAEEALAGAPEVEDGRFSVPRILGEDA